MKQVEVEFISSAKGVVALIDLIKDLYDASALSTLRIYDQDKVGIFLHLLSLINTQK